jgi:hypothetical protein
MGRESCPKLNVITSLKTGSISARSKRGSAGEGVVSMHRTLALSTVVVLFKVAIKPPLQGSNPIVVKFGVANITNSD